MRSCKNCGHDDWFHIDKIGRCFHDEPRMKGALILVGSCECLCFDFIK